MNKLIETLIKEKLTLITIESFTGGGLAHHFIKHTGASRWFKQGFVLYQAEAKAQYLGMPLEALNKIDPVSEALVKKLLVKALEINPRTISIVTTGNAGPNVQGQQKVGDFYIGISDGKHEHIQFGQAKGSRIQIQQSGVKMAVKMLSEFLSTYYVVSPK